MMDVAAILAALTALEIQIHLRELDNNRLAAQAQAMWAEERFLTAKQWGAWYWPAWSDKLVPIAWQEPERAVA